MIDITAVQKKLEELEEEYRATRDNPDKATRSLDAIRLQGKGYRTLLWNMKKRGQRKLI